MNFALFFAVMELVGNAWQSFMDAPDYSEYSPWFPNPLICLRDIARTGVNEVRSKVTTIKLSPYYDRLLQPPVPLSTNQKFFAVICLTPAYVWRFMLNSIFPRADGTWEMALGKCHGVGDIMHVQG